MDDAAAVVISTAWDKRLGHNASLRFEPANQKTRSDAGQSGFAGVEAIGRNSNLGHLCKRWTDLRKRTTEAPATTRTAQDGPNPRSKRFLTAEDVVDIVHRCQVGETTRGIGNRYGISKTRVADVLCEQGVAIRRHGFNAEQVNEAATLYAAGKSLAWIGDRYGVAHTTVAAALRRKGLQLRRRPGWM